MIPIERAIGKYLFDSYDARKKEIVTSLRDTDQILYRVYMKHIYGNQKMMLLNVCI